MSFDSGISLRAKSNTNTARVLISLVANSVTYVRRSKDIVKRSVFLLLEGGQG